MQSFRKKLYIHVKKHKDDTNTAQRISFFLISGTNFVNTQFLFDQVIVIATMLNRPVQIVRR